MVKADAAKRLIEEAQRKRRAEGNNYEPRFFEHNQTVDFWECRLDRLDSLWKTILQKDAERRLADLSIEDKPTATA